MTRPLGIYVSIPFCRAKCTFCNFASGAFPPARIDAYVDRLVDEMDSARARKPGLSPAADTLSFGGGTPSLLTADQFRRILQALGRNFVLTPNAEITVEAAPGQLADDLLATMLDCGVNRISLGVQSFNDAETRAVGRLHTAEGCLAEISRLRSAGFENLSLDLIAGLPLQTEQSFANSLQTALDSHVDHVSVYMLELDEESRLGSEVLSRNDAGGRAISQLAVLGQHARYYAAAVPEPDLIATLYEDACCTLNAAGLAQYEISNFGRPCCHNLKYWHRAPYIGFGLDAHSMLTEEEGAVRFANPDDLDTYLSHSADPVVDYIDQQAAFEEAVFLGLRLVDGLSLSALRTEHGHMLTNTLLQRAYNLANADIVTLEDDRLRLTPRGRAISSAVFGELLA